MNIRLKPIDAYDVASIDKPLIYAIQSKVTKTIVAVHSSKDMAMGIVNMLNANKILYFTDGYIVRELYKDDVKWIESSLND